MDTLFGYEESCLLADAEHKGVTDKGMSTLAVLSIMELAGTKP